MELRTYLNSCSFDEQKSYASRSGTTLGYLRKALSTSQQIGERICIGLERESGGLVTCEELRPDVDWGYLRGTAKQRSKRG